MKWKVLKNLAYVNNEDGFTLVEILVVIAIIGILATIAIPVFLNQKRTAIDASLQSDLKQMVNAQMTYVAENRDTHGSMHGAPFAIRESDSTDLNGSHNSMGLSFNPSPGNYIRTPYVTESGSNKVIGICIIVWNLNSKKYPNQEQGLAWNSVRQYDATPAGCATG